MAKNTISYEEITEFVKWLNDNLPWLQVSKYLTSMGLPFPNELFTPLGKKIWAEKQKTLDMSELINDGVYQAWKNIPQLAPGVAEKAAQVPGMIEAGELPPIGKQFPTEQELQEQAVLEYYGGQKIGDKYFGYGRMFDTLDELSKYGDSQIKGTEKLYPVSSDILTIKDQNGKEWNVFVTYNPDGSYNQIQLMGSADEALSPQDQALATMGIFKNESGQFVDEFGMVLGNTPEEARARYQQRQEFEKFLSERLTPFQQEQLALEKERMRQAAKPSLGEITQASIMEKQAWMSPFAAPVPWATRWSARAGGEFTPKAQTPPIQSPVQSWAR